MELRTTRVFLAIEYVESAMAGNMRCSQPLLPLTGSHLRLTPKTSISIRPSQKTGMDCPRSAKSIPP